MMSLSPSKRNVYELEHSVNNPNKKKLIMIPPRWEENQGTYTHKKFKKAASSVIVGAASEPLKHSALSMVNGRSPEAFPSAQQAISLLLPSSSGSSENEGDKHRRKQHLCPFCPTACAKPSVLDKHIRTHTNERPFPCNPCGFAFKTKSNLYKHRKSRTHILKLETGIDSSGAEIFAELGESVQEEIDSSSSHSPNSSVIKPVPQPHVIYPSNTSSPNVLPEDSYSQQQQPTQSPVTLVSSSHSSITPKISSSSTSSVMDGHSSSIRQARPVPSHHLLVQSQRILIPPPPPSTTSSLIKSLQPLPVQNHPTDLSASSSTSGGGHPQSLQQRIDKVISENQAIVETLDPLWPRRYMRQNSKDGNSEDKFSSSNARLCRKYNSIASPPTTNSSLMSSSVLVVTSSSHCSSSPPTITTTTNSTKGEYRFSTPSAYSPVLQPLNLSEPSSSRKRSFTQSEFSSTPASSITAKSVKELWLNSCRQSKNSPTNTPTANMEQLEAIAQNLEAGNAFHPQNPEGSMIKELLLNTRMSNAGSVSPTPVSTVLISSKQTPPPLKKKLIFVSSSSNAVFCNLCSSSIRGTDIDSHQRLYCPSNKAKKPRPSLSTEPGLLQISVKKVELSTAPTVCKSLESHSNGVEVPISENSLKVDVENEGTGKFLRPSFLPLTPGSFRPKKAIMQIGNGATLASPETPRPRKSYVLQYQNGTAYTYLGLKSTTRVYYCSIFRSQPMFVPHKPRLSMYSNWRVVSKDSHPSRLTPQEGLSAYNSSYKKGYVMATSSTKDSMIMTHSSLWKRKPCDKGGSRVSHELTSHSSPNSSSSSLATISKEEGNLRSVEGGYKTTDDDDYTYVRGRGRGRYVCNSCGIRCKKPSMLKKHLRTHSNFRPYMCRICNFAFKTKGNLTKHMKSKAHHKKCVELGISPEEICQVDEISLAKQGVSATSAEGGFQAGDSDSDEDDFDEDEDEEDEQFEDAEEETEAAHSLLSLSHQPPYLTSTSPRDNRGLTPSSLRLSISPFVLSSPCSNSSSIISSSMLTTNAISEHVSRNTQRAGEFQEENGGGVKFSLDRIYFPPASNDPSSITTPKTASSFCHETPMTQSSTILSYINKTSSAVPKTAFENPPALQDYLRERAVIKAAATPFVSQSTHTTELITTPSSSMTISSISVSELSNPRPYPSLNAVIPRNVVMNVKDIPNSSTESSSNVISPPEIVVPRSSSSSSKPISVGSEDSGAQDIFQTNEDGKSVCGICHKVFSKPSQLRLHVNIHYFERPFRCDSCAVSFRTKGHLQKHKRSVGHYNKVNINATFGAPTTANPRPFKCSDCKVAFRIHGHLAKHLRSKMHIMKLECSGKLPIGMFAEMERLGTNLNEIDTSDCENSLESLQQIAFKLYKKDPSKLTAPEDAAATSQPSDISDNEDETPHHLPGPPPSPFTVFPSPSIKSETSPDELPHLSGQQQQQHHFREPLVPSALSKSRQSSLEESMDFERDKILQCSSCKISFHDIKSLQVHNYVEHNGSSCGIPVEPPSSRPKQSSPSLLLEKNCSNVIVIPPAPTMVAAPSLPIHHHTYIHPAQPQNNHIHRSISPPKRLYDAVVPSSNMSTSSSSKPNLPPRRIPQILGSSSVVVASVLPRIFNPRDEKTFDCELCGVSIVGSNPFSQHLMSHAAPRPYVCPDCDAGFPSTRQLEAHMQLHTFMPS